MKGRNFRSILIGVFLIAILLIAPAIMVSVGQSLKKTSVYEYEGLPRIEIYLNGVELEDINSDSKNIKYAGNDLVAYSSIGVERYTDVEISGRGNLTWVQKKKPYALKFDKKVDILGMGKAKRFVLMANYLDDSALRNDTAMKLAMMVGEEYTHGGEYVELYVDGEYQGLYYLMHKIEIGKASVDLKNPYGILMELDNLHGSAEVCYRTYAGTCLVAIDEVNKDNLNRAAKDFLDDYNKLEMAAEKGDFDAANSVADLVSFARYYLVSEFSSNPDAYATSWFFYKDGLDDQIHTGVSWDFDLAFANKIWAGSEFFAPDKTRVREKDVFDVGYYDSDGNYVDGPSDKNTSRLMYYLLRMPEFERLVKNMFLENLSGRLDELVDWIEMRAAQIDVAVREDADKWEKKDFEENTEKLISWVQRRYKYFEEIYGKNAE